MIEERELLAVRAALKLLQPDDPTGSPGSAAPPPDATVRIRSGAGHE